MDEKKSFDKCRNISEYTDQYLKSPFLVENNDYRRRAILRELNKYNHNNILEIGCGIFPIISYLNEAEYHSYTIVEPSTVFADNARLIINNNHLNDKVIVINDFFENANMTEKFDFVICSSLLHEVNKPDELLISIKNACNEDTVVHLNVPNAKSLHRLIALYGGLIDNIYNLSDRNKDLQQRSVYDIESLTATVERIGFRILDKGSFFIKPFTHEQMGQMIEQKIIGNMVLEGLWGLADLLPEYGSEIYVNMKLK